MKRSFCSGLPFKLVFNFVAIVCVVFFIGNSIQLSLNQKELEKQGREIIQRQDAGYAEKIDKTEKELINQFPPLIDMIAEFSKAPLLARISETNHSNIDVVGSLRNCFSYYKSEDDIKQCTDMLVFRFIANHAITEVIQTFISTAIHFLIKNEDMVGIFVEDWDGKTYIGFYRSLDGNLEEWRRLDQISHFPFMEKEVLDEDGEYLGKIVLAYDLSRIELLKRQAKTQLALDAEKIQKNILKNRKTNIYINLIEGVLFSVVLVICLFFVSIRLIIRPIHSLEYSANQIAKGYLNTRSTIYSKDEIGALAESLNNMAKNLQTTMTSRDKLALEVKQRKMAEKEKQKVINELEEAIENIKTLSGLIPICSNCKKIRDDKGYWNNLEFYIQQHSDASFSHGICPECSDELYGDEDWYIEMKKKEGI